MKLPETIPAGQAAHSVTATGISGNVLNFAFMTVLDIVKGLQNQATPTGPVRVATHQEYCPLHKNAAKSPL